MAHLRQSRPYSGLDFQVKILKTFESVPSSLGSEACAHGLSFHVKVCESAPTAASKAFLGLPSCTSSAALEKRPRVTAFPLPSEEGTIQTVLRLLPESQGQNLALTVLCAAHSLDIG